MSEKSIEEILKSPFPREAAESLWTTMREYGNKPALERRLKNMATAGIISEATDLIEALEMEPEDALPHLITAYENASQSALSTVNFSRREGRDDLAEDDIQTAKQDKLHADKLRNGEITVAQEIQARIKQREERENPDNYYISLLKLKNSLTPEEK